MHAMLWARVHNFQSANTSQYGKRIHFKQKKNRWQLTIEPTSFLHDSLVASVICSGSRRETKKNGVKQWHFKSPAIRIHRTMKKEKQSAPLLDRITSHVHSNFNRSNAESNGIFRNIKTRSEFFVSHIFILAAMHAIHCIDAPEECFSLHSTNCARFFFLSEIAFRSIDVFCGRPCSLTFRARFLPVADASAHTWIDNDCNTYASTVEWWTFRFFHLFLSFLGFIIKMSLFRPPPSTHPPSLTRCNDFAFRIK